MAENNLCIELNQVGKSVDTPDGKLDILNNISLDVKYQEAVVIKGASGSGKTTLLGLMAGLDQASSGEVYLFGENLAGKNEEQRSSIRAGRVGFVFQSFHLVQGANALQNVMLPLELGGKEQPRKIANEIMQKVGLGERWSHYPSQLSGGEKQRICIARALAAEPDLIICDEVTSALDQLVAEEILKLLLNLQRKLQVSYLFITHELSLMRDMSSRVAIMYLGKICEIASTAEFFSNPLHPYTQMLLSSIPVVSEQEEQLKPKKIQSTGEIPSPVDIPPGCSFHRRCPRRMEICSSIDPVIVTPEGGHQVRCHLFPGAAGEAA